MLTREAKTEKQKRRNNNTLANTQPETPLAPHTTVYGRNTTPGALQGTRRAAARRVRVQPPMPPPAPAPAPNKTSPHTPGRAAETPGAPRARHHLSHPSTPTAGGSRVPATTATVLHVAARCATWPCSTPESSFDRADRTSRWHSKARHSGNKKRLVCVCVTK